jgi:predicted transcriptional regulator
LERLCDILFEVSNEDRLSILRRLVEEPMKVTSISRELGFTNQECSRHISRLSEVGLTLKDTDGSYSISPFGGLMLRMLPSLEFITGYREYFIFHSVASLPQEFVSRMGELAESTLVEDVMVIFHNVENVINEAEEYVWRITDRYLITALDELSAAVDRGVKVRLLEPKDIVYPPNWEGPGPIIDEARVRGQFISRLLEKADVFIAMSEKEVAGISFPLEDGRFDYHGFTATDENSYNWCRDVFEYYWMRSEARGSDPVTLG